jgi:hypothetical protein
LSQVAAVAVLVTQVAAVAVVLERQSPAQHLVVVRPQKVAYHYLKALTL